MTGLIFDVVKNNFKPKYRPKMKENFKDLI